MSVNNIQVLKLFLHLVFFFLEYFKLRLIRVLENVAHMKEVLKLQYLDRKNLKPDSQTQDNIKDNFREIGKSVNRI
jgi:hypothetical protein